MNRWSKVRRNWQIPKSRMPKCRHVATERTRRGPMTEAAKEPDDLRDTQRASAQYNLSNTSRNSKGNAPLQPTTVQIHKRRDPFHKRIVGQHLVPQFVLGTGSQKWGGGSRSIPRVRALAAPLNCRARRCVSSRAAPWQLRSWMPLQVRSIAKWAHLECGSLGLVISADLAPPVHDMDVGSGVLVPDSLRHRPRPVGSPADCVKLVSGWAGGGPNT